MLNYERARKSLGSASLEIQIYAHHTIRHDKRISSLKDSVESVLTKSSSGIKHFLNISYMYSFIAGSVGISQVLQRTDASGTPAQITFAIAEISPDSNVDRLNTEEALSHARQGIGNLNPNSNITGDICNMLQAVPTDAAFFNSFLDTWDALLNKIEIFSRITDHLGEVRSRVEQ